MAAWLDSYACPTSGALHTGALLLDWSMVSKSWKPEWYPAVVTTINGSPRGVPIHVAGYPHKIWRNEQPAKAYFRWQDNPFNYNEGIDWFLGSHMDEVTWATLTDERKKKFHPCGPLFQISPWVSIDNIDHWCGVTDDPEEAREDRDKVMRPQRIPLQWYPFEPHYCHWDEFKDKEFEIE